MEIEHDDLFFETKQKCLLCWEYFSESVHIRRVGLRIYARNNFSSRKSFILTFSLINATQYSTLCRIIRLTCDHSRSYGMSPFEDILSTTTWRSSERSAQDLLLSSSVPGIFSVLLSSIFSEQNWSRDFLSLYLLSISVWN